MLSEKTAGLAAAGRRPHDREALHAVVLQALHDPKLARLDQAGARGAGRGAAARPRRDPGPGLDLSELVALVGAGHGSARAGGGW